jgi:ADP-ribose 1''-phosphate phosphatase
MDDNYAVGCLFTSSGYGSRVDDKELILLNTEKALKELFLFAKDFGINTIHSPKFNSGLFRVPWPETEAVLKRLLPDGITWTVWEL